MNKIETLKQHAKELYENMEWLRDEKNNPLRVIITPREGDIHDELLYITHEVNKQTSLSMDSTYAFTMEVLEAIISSEAEDEDTLREVGFELESDTYTSELTNWLNESNYHIEYLTRALQEFSPEDGFQVLGLAQKIAKEEVYTIVLDELLK